MSKKRKVVESNPYPLWDYVEKQGKIEGGGNNQFQCSICSEIYQGSYTRVRAHLLHENCKGIGPCGSIDPESLNTLKQLQNDADMRSQLGKSRVSNLPLPGAKNLGNALKNGENAFDQLFHGKSRDVLDRTIARFFYGCGIPFHVIRSSLFRDMIQYAANNNIAGYVPPSADRLSRKLLEEEKDHVDKMLAPIKSGWKRTGVSIVSDGWSDNNSRPLINFMGASSSGAVFLKAIDTSGNYKDASYLASLFVNTIQEVGVKNVVQLVTDNAPVCRAAAMQVERIFSHIFWTPCVAHTLNLALRDLCECKPTAKYQTRFEEFKWMQDLIMLLRLAEVKSALLAMVVDQDWKDYKGDDVTKAQQVKNMIVDDDWWDNVAYLINLTAPIVDFLRFTDTDKSTLHLVYEKWDSMIEKVRLVIFEHEESNLIEGSCSFYEEVHNVLVRRWNKSNNPLICLAHCLNPKFYSEEWIEGGLNRVPPHRDEELSNGRNTCFERLFTSSADKTTIKEQYGAFSGCKGGFSNWASQRDRNTDDPTSWWNNYGAAAPLLANLADRLMNQPSSASSAERNWSTYSNIQNAKRNKLHPKRAETLVYVHSSIRLLSRSEDRYVKGPTQYWDVLMDETRLDAPTDQELANSGLNIPTCIAPPCTDTVEP